MTAAALAGLEDGVTRGADAALFSTLLFGVSLVDPALISTQPGLGLEPRTAEPGPNGFGEVGLPGVARELASLSGEGRSPALPSDCRRRPGAKTQTQAFLCKRQAWRRSRLSDSAEVVCKARRNRRRSVRILQLLCWIVRVTIKPQVRAATCTHWQLSDATLTRLTHAA